MIKTLWRLSRESIRYRKLYTVAILSTYAQLVALGGSYARMNGIQYRETTPRLKNKGIKDKPATDNSAAGLCCLVIAKSKGNNQSLSLSLLLLSFLNSGMKAVLKPMSWRRSFI